MLLGGFVVVALFSVCRCAAPVNYVFPTEQELQSNSTDKPLGYSSGTLVHPPEQDGNFKVKLTGLDDSYVDVKIETVNDGVSICAKSNLINTNQVCGLGQAKNCFEAEAREMTIEFYCEDSCSSSPSEPYYYRFVKSPKGVSDQWCTDRQTEKEFPSDLTPAVIPNLKTTQPPPTTLGNRDVLVLPTTLLTIVSVLIVYLLN